MNDNYKASKEDLKYFNSSLKIFFLIKVFFEIFDLKKIKKFILKFLNYFGLVILRGFIILSYSLFN